jgi:hypothetical protein
MDGVQLARRGKEKERVCDVMDCDAEAVRSISGKKAVPYIKHLGLKDPDKRRIHLCKEHYKIYKKGSKKDRQTERLGWIRRDNI